MSAKFTRAPQMGLGTKPPTPSTWDYATVWPGATAVLATDLAHATCPNGHTRRIVSTVHSIAADGTVSPSYVCTAPGCVFHNHVQLVGWGES